MCRFAIEELGDIYVVGWQHVSLRNIVIIMYKSNLQMHGAFAAGDNTTMFRSLAIAIADGNKAGAIINTQLVDESF